MPMRKIPFVGGMAGRDVTTLPKWWSSAGDRPIAVVTGGNRGIGFEISRQLSRAGVAVVIASRDELKGKEAVAAVRSETPDALVETFPADITNIESIYKLGDFVQKMPGTFSILINNAGMAYKGDTWGYKEATQTFLVNFDGTRETCKALLPLLDQSNSRIVNTGSRAGSTSILRSASLLNAYENAAKNGTEDDVIGLASDFLEAEKGYPRSMYGMSKLAMHTYTRVLARELSTQRPGVMVSCMCPGSCRTDMNPRGGRSAAEGADTAVWLSLVPKNELETGCFWAERQQISW